MKSVIAISLSFMIMQAMSFAECAEVKEVVITIFSERNVILPCEPLGVAVILQNKSSEMIEKIGSQWTFLKIKKEGVDGNWQTYMACGPHATLIPPKKLRLLSGQSFEDICLIHVNSNNEPVFNDSGVYYVQAGTPFGESSVMKIIVDLPEASVEAVETMRSKKLFMLFDEYTASCFLGEDRSLEILSKSLNNFRGLSGSAPYSAWINFGDFILKKTMISRHPETKQSVLYEKLIAEYEAVASKLPSPQKESLMMAMASVRMEHSQKNAALVLLQQIVSTHTNGYFKISAQYLQSLYEKR